MKKSKFNVFAVLFAMAVLMVITTATVYANEYNGVSFEKMAQQKPLEGIVERDGHYYIYKRGRMLTGKVKYKGHTYYCHKTASKDYPYGSMTRGMMRIESGNRWYAYKWDGTMYTKDVYYRKGRFRKILTVKINPKTHCVTHVYPVAASQRAWRYSTAERKWQRERMFGEYYTPKNSKRCIPDWVDLQR